MRTLIDAGQGEQVTIRRIHCGSDRAVRQRLLDMGVSRGVQVTVVRPAPLGDPLEIALKGYHLAVRKSEAGLIEIEGSSSL